MIRPTLRTAAVMATGLILVAAAAPTLAQTPPQPESAAELARLQALGETYHRAPDTAQDPDELAATAKLNAMIAAHNEAVARQEAADTAAQAEAEARYRAEAAAAATLQANYEADQRTAAAARAEYERARATWEAMIRACEASGRRDCRAPAPD
ncbi:cell wall hydrolase [uncultured Brevundimonas sp.]|uniref:cell wall hydrolase n=1 Tax=uncultured Brevundimonas sp. TaxID=213418 RepID=UPI0030EE76B5|tara:strand:+ start:1913 stop:2374 length:462 start_codon:yes stop_codon:yes gene_type:complete